MYWIIYISLPVAAILIWLYLYAFRYEPVNFNLSNVDIFIKEKTSSATGEDKPKKPLLTILHLSDFHLRKNFKGIRLFKFVQSLAGLDVDFIFITGDLIGSSSSMEYMIEMLAPLKARLGKYAVFGVHDHYDKALTEFMRNMLKRKKSYRKENDIAGMVRNLKNIGIEALINESRKIEFDTNGIKSIEIIGLDDPIVKKIDIARAFGNIDPVSSIEPVKKSDYRKVFALSKKKIHEINNRGKLRIAIIHTPDTDSIINLAWKETDIILSGHTHGGQVRLPLIGAIISGCKIKTKFASGLFYFRTLILYVTRGLGEGKYSQFRFYCPPEASLLRIYKVD
ncbi:MAG TPA: metallophosphoesterase [Candidatus Humimicrobiaceae bacterium]|nr:metallophosphoesterase [Candidatus Humimicrobiaceae bacterium]